MNKSKKELPHLGRLARYPYFGMMVEGHKRLVKAGFDALDPSYSIIFQFIGDGSRITDLAKKGQTSKQNVKYLVDVLEQKGYVQRRPDTIDNRSNIYSLTEKGHAYRNAGLRINKEIEEEWAVQLGKRNMGKLKELLWTLANIIEEQTSDNSEPAGHN